MKWEDREFIHGWRESDHEVYDGRVGDLMVRVSNADNKTARTEIGVRKGDRVGYPQHCCSRDFE